jgi:hypothetical protein
MSSVGHYDSRTRIKRAEAAPELSIIVGCHTFACAIPTRVVVRLALMEDVEVVDQEGGTLVRSAEEWFAVENLGTLLSLKPLAGAWVLLRLPYGAGSVNVALRTGPCFAVRPVAVEAPLPPGLFELRGEAVKGAFVAAGSGVQEALYGLVLSVEELFSQAELSVAAQALSRVRGGRIG